ncbi:tripartite tricarboxylate transporter substrate binding protein [Massilia antarctica]|uniref:Tripartite tricarboxylate transporter substrate binding protein n=1 Tax=Massilia antarctica TaxID=2765360 RepID=A0AA49A8S4_9BURK|nr:tripartite tricarboxylate transporter substrate-binding protein [Massilia antarctica]QPI49925.1 tripartite tricarboxylate transporter substrate binding protein [Massilia antarctica]
MKSLFSILMAGAALHCAGAECIVPSKPGGAMDLTCKLAREGLRSEADAPALRLSYLPGGIGAVAWHTMAAQRGSEKDTLVAFSGGSLLNLAQGKFGKASADDVRWVAALGADYGMIAVRSDSAFRNLADLIDALRREPEKVLIGVSGTIGSQDWMKMALLARSAGIDPKVLRFVALEGGGEAFTAMHANHVQVVSGDASEATLYAGAGAGKVRVLAVLSERRLPGVLSQAPTAREQGVDVVWPIIRGVWMGPKVADAEYQRWVGSFERMTSSADFARLRAAHGLYPFTLTGPALTDYIHKAVADYNRQARQFKLIR